MNWIKILFPPPQFDLSGHAFFRFVKGFGLTIAYYFSQLLALLGLTLIYFLVICPLRLWIRNKLSEKNSVLHRDSFLMASRGKARCNFQRMY